MAPSKSSKKEQEQRRLHACVAKFPSGGSLGVKDLLASVRELKGMVGPTLGLVGGLYLLTDRLPKVSLASDEGKPLVEQLEKLLKEAADLQKQQGSSGGSKAGSAAQQQQQQQQQQGSLVLAWLRVAGHEKLLEAARDEADQVSVRKAVLAAAATATDVSVPLEAWQTLWADPKLEHPDAAMVEALSSERLGTELLWLVHNKQLNAALKLKTAGDPAAAASVSPTMQRLKALSAQRTQV
jgi:hypothetical protein